MVYRPTKEQFSLKIFVLVIISEPKEMYYRKKVGLVFNFQKVSCLQKPF